MNIEFYRPEFSLIFGVIFFLIYQIIRTHFLRKKFSQILQSTKTLEINHTQKHPKNRIFKETLFILGISFIALSLMRPKWGEKHSVKKVVGSDLCIALDLSQSMLAEDMSPNRLEYAKRELIVLLETLNKTKVTLVGFAGGAFIASPLTSDLDAISDYLTPLNPSFVSLPSTYIEGAIITCTEALGYKDITDSRSETEKENTAGSILLVTDGDDKNKIEPALLKGLLKYKIPISTLLIGKNQGTLIPQKNQEGHSASFVKDPATGLEAKTKAEKEFVSLLAEKTNGRVYVADESTNFKESFTEDLKKLEFKLKEEGIEIEKEEKFQIPLIIGILLLLVEWIITETGGVFLYYRSKYFKNTLKTIILLGFFAESNLKAAGLLNSVENNFGVFIFKLENYSFAQKLFEEALNDEPNEKQYTFNWISSRLNQIEINQRNKQTEKESDPEIEEVLEISNILESLAKKETDPMFQKKWFFQLGQASELSKKIPDAINNYYNSLKEPASKNLDPMSRHNLARLLKKNSENQGSGGGGGGGGGGGQSNGKGQSNKNQEPNDENKKPQEYKGKNFTPDQVKQIMQNINSEERKIIKKKSQNEAQKKGNNLGRGNESSKPW